MPTTLASVNFNGSHAHIVKGITHISETQRTSESTECSQDATQVRITRVRQDDGCLSVFEKWLNSKKHGTISIDYADACGHKSHLCFSGYACKLERHTLKECDVDLPVEVLTIQIGAPAPCAPLVLPQAPVAKFSDGSLCFTVKIMGGCLSDASIAIRNVLPCPWGTSWTLRGGPAPGTDDPKYTSPKPFWVKACLDVSGLDQEGIDSLYHHLQKETKYVFVFTENEGSCETQSNCFDLCLPEKPTLPDQPPSKCTACTLFTNLQQIDIPTGQKEVEVEWCITDGSVMAGQSFRVDTERFLVVAKDANSTQSTITFSNGNRESVTIPACFPFFDCEGSILFLENVTFTANDVTTVSIRNCSGGEINFGDQLATPENSPLPLYVTESNESSVSVYNAVSQSLTYQMCDPLSFATSTGPRCGRIPFLYLPFFCVSQGQSTEATMFVCNVPEPPSSPITLSYHFKSLYQGQITVSFTEWRNPGNVDVTIMSDSEEKQYFIPGNWIVR
jgi:hypothetical protein